MDLTRSHHACDLSLWCGDVGELCKCGMEVRGDI